MSPSVADVVRALESIYPPSLAEPWDNVGLLVPPPGGLEARCRRVLCTIDATEEVVAEAASLHVDLLVSYHPPIFAPISRLDPARAADRAILRAIRAGVAVHAPHTAVDAAPGGVNDWLADALGPGARRPIAPARVAPGGAAIAGAGQGRIVELEVPVALGELVSRVKAHLGLSHVRLAASARHAAGAPVRSVALCAGAGGKLFEAVGEVDLLWTGEMRHHDVLSRVAAGASVVLCDHTNTERGFLHRLATALASGAPGVEVRVSERDREPLVVT